MAINSVTGPGSGAYGGGTGEKAEVRVILWNFCG